MAIRVGLTLLGNIEAAIFEAGVIRCVVVDKRTGDLLDHTNVYPHTDLFRQLVRAAREHVSKPDRKEME